MTATAAGLTGSPLVFSATALPGPAAGYTVSLNVTAPVAGSTVAVTAQLVDSLGNLVAAAGRVVTWSSSGAPGAFATQTSPTDATGKATVQFTTSAVVASGSVTARDAGGLSGTSAGFTSVPGPASTARSTVQPSAAVLAADGISRLTIVVQLRDANGNALNSSGGTVVITVTAGTLSATTDNHDGTYVALLTAPNAPGAGSVGATLNGTPLAGVAISFVPSTPAEYVLTSSATSPVAGTAVTITAQLANVSGGPVQIAGRVVAWQKIGLGGTFATAQSTTNAGGVATVSFTTGASTAAYQIVAIDNSSISGSFQLATVAGSAARYVVTANTTTPEAGSSVPLTAQLADANGNAVSTSGRAVTWSVTGESGGAFAPSISQTSAAGAALTSYTTGTSIGTTYVLSALDANGLTGSVNVSNAAGLPATLTWTSGHIVVTDTTFATADVLHRDERVRPVDRDAPAVVREQDGVGRVGERRRHGRATRPRADDGRRERDRQPFREGLGALCHRDAGAPVIRTDLSRFDLGHDTTFTLVVIADMRSATLLGAATVELRWDPAMLTYVSDAEAGSGVGALVGSTNAANGSLVITAASASGFGGTVQLRRVTFHVSSTTGRTGPFTLLVTELTAATSFTSLLATTLAISYPLVIR